MSLTVTNSTLARQQAAIQSQIAAAQTAAVSTASSSDSTAATSSAAASSPAAQLISGNATLTSDLLSVLLNEQSGGASSSSSSGSVTLAGILDSQDAATQAQTDGSGQPSLLGDLAASTQSASSTGSVVAGLQSLLEKLAV